MKPVQSSSSRVRPASTILPIGVLLLGIWSTSCSDVLKPEETAPLSSTLQDASQQTGASQDRIETRLIERHWQATSIGQDGEIESFPAPEGTVLISGSGSGFGDRNDSIRFVFHPLRENGFVAARLTRDKASVPVETGLMIREDLTAESRFASISLRADGTLVFRGRAERNQPPFEQMAALPLDAIWLKLVREGDALVGWYSADGEDWIQLSASTVPMAAIVNAGLAVSARSDGLPDIAAFTEISLLDVRLSSPSQGSPALLPNTPVLQPTIFVHGTDIRRVEFFSSTQRIGEVHRAPFEFSWTNSLAGRHQVLALVTDIAGRQVFTESVELTLKLSPARVRYLAVDETTQGDWKGHYGELGFLIISERTNLPPAVSIVPSHHEEFAWAHTTQNRALTRVDASGRIAATWYSKKQFAIDLRFLDGLKHRVALYFLDWDTENQRMQTVSVFDAQNQTPIDQQLISSFSAGKYMLWELQGDVRMTITSTGHGVAVLSGIFVDPPE
jgi:regulation of enolase protein 1 (concanavalin A-like superfamily)